MTPTSIGHISLIDHSLAITPTSTSFGRDLSKLVEIYTNKVTYSGWNNSFIFQLANL